MDDGRANKHSYTSYGYPARSTCCELVSLGPGDGRQFWFCPTEISSFVWECCGVIVECLFELVKCYHQGSTHAMLSNTEQ